MTLKLFKVRLSTQEDGNESLVSAHDVESAAEEFVEDAYVQLCEHFEALEDAA